jgi:hypothetical protein
VASAPIWWRWKHWLWGHWWGVERVKLFKSRSSWSSFLFFPFVNMFTKGEKEDWDVLLRALLLWVERSCCCFCFYSLSAELIYLWSVIFVVLLVAFVGS